MKTYFEEIYSVRNQENKEKINLLTGESVKKSQSIQILEEKVENLERKIISLGKLYFIERRKVQ